MMNKRIPTTDFRHDVPAESRNDCGLNCQGFAVEQSSSYSPGRNLAMSPLEAVRMVTWQIDPVSILERGGLLAGMSDEKRAELGLDAHWSIAAAFDCRTRVNLGMSLTHDSEPSAAISCLRMISRDKGAICSAAGVVGQWSQHGIPEWIVADNGAPLASSAFVAACHDLGISIKRTVANGHAGNDVIERRLQAAIDECLSATCPMTAFVIISSALAARAPDHIRMAMVRRIVGIYHATPQAGLGDRTPLEMWEDDHQSGILALRAAARVAPRQDEQKCPFNG